MIVDDSPDLRVLIKQALELDGLEVEAAESGEEACRLIEGGSRPAVILLDLMMPGIGGRGFLKWIKERDDVSDIPVVILSASNLNTTLDGAERFLRKPVDLNELLDVVGHHVHGNPG